MAIKFGGNLATRNPEVAYCSVDEHLVYAITMCARNGTLCCFSASPAGWASRRWAPAKQGTPLRTISVEAVQKLVPFVRSERFLKKRTFEAAHACCGLTGFALTRSPRNSEVTTAFEAMARPGLLGQEQQILAQKSHEAYLLADRLGTRVKEAHLMAGRQLSSAAQFQQMADAASRHIDRTTAAQFKKLHRHKKGKARLPHSDTVAQDRRLLQLPAPSSKSSEASRNAAEMAKPAVPFIMPGSQFDDQSDLSLVSNKALRTPMFLVGRHTRPWQYTDSGKSQRQGQTGSNASDPTLIASTHMNTQQQMKSEEVGMSRPNSRSAPGTPRSFSAAEPAELSTGQIHAGKRTTLLSRHELAQLEALGPLNNPLSLPDQRLSRTERVEVLYAWLMASTREHVGRFAEAVRWQPPPHIAKAMQNPTAINSIHQVMPGPATATSGSGDSDQDGVEGKPSTSPVHLPTATLLQFVLERIELGAAHVPQRLRYSRRHFGMRFMTQGVAFLAEALTWLVHCMTWRSHGSSKEQEVLLTVVAVLYKQLMTHVTGMGRDSFFRYLLPAVAETAWCAIWFAIPGSRGHYDAALKLRVYLIVMRVVAGMEMSPMSVQNIMHESFPDTVPDAPVNVSLMLNSAVLGDSSAALGNVVEIGDALAQSRASSGQEETDAAREASAQSHSGDKPAKRAAKSAGGTSFGANSSDLAIGDALQANSLLESVHLTPAQRASLGHRGAYEYQTLRSLPEHAFVPHTAYVAAFEYAYQYLVENKIMELIEAGAAGGFEGVEPEADADADAADDGDWRVQSRKRAAAHQLAMQLIKQRVKYRDISVKLPVRATSTNLQRVLPGKRIVGGRQYQMKYSTLTPWSETGGIDTFTPVLQRMLRDGQLGQQMLSLELQSPAPLPNPRADDASRVREQEEVRQARRQVLHGSGVLRASGVRNGQAPHALAQSDSSPELLQATTREGADQVPRPKASVPAMHASKSAASLGISARISASGLGQRAAGVSNTAARNAAAAAREARGVVRQLKSPYETVHGVSAAARVIQARHMGIHPSRRRAQAQRATLTKDGQSALGVGAPLVGTDGEMNATRHVDTRTGALVATGGLSVAAVAARKAAVAMFGDSDGDGVLDASGIARATAVSDGQGLASMGDDVPPSDRDSALPPHQQASRALHRSVQDEIAAAAAVSASLASTLQRASQRALVQDGASSASAILADQGSTVDRSGMKAVSMGPLASAEELLAANFSPLNPQRQSSQFRHVRMALPRPNPLMRLHRTPGEGDEDGGVADDAGPQCKLGASHASSPKLPPVGRNTHGMREAPRSPLRHTNTRKPRSAGATVAKRKARVAVIDGQLVHVVQADVMGTAAADGARAKVLQQVLGSSGQVDDLLNQAGEGRTRASTATSIYGE